MPPDLLENAHFLTGLGPADFFHPKTEKEQSAEIIIFVKELPEEKAFILLFQLLALLFGPAHDDHFSKLPQFFGFWFFLFTNNRYGLLGFPDIF